ncbi:MAG: N-acetylmuramidase family protein [Muribaculaceae bacterium]|nr:N-acetylmuramidase family protein [Muribaculaceae bacterium]
MKSRSAILLTIAVAVASGAGAACIGSGRSVANDSTRSEQKVDTVVMPWGEVRLDTVASPTPKNETTDFEVIDPATGVSALAIKMAEEDADSRYTTLTDHDYSVVAEELGVEIAAIKAVVRIEAGASLEGFFAPGVPVINFDRAMYNKARATSNAKAPASTSIPEGIKSSYGRKEWQQLINARKVNIDKANMGTFWGMFQIGGFNYKLCGCSTVQEFVDRMSFSEFEQLQLFANFIKNTGMVNDLRNKNWAAFARKYNGASYKARGYHTRMANEYRKYKAQE